MLLVITQKVDSQDPVLGFMSGWLRALAQEFGPLGVICLERGEVDDHLVGRVHSLGKEEGSSRIKYIWRLFKYLWRERKNYEAVFVHMNQEYVLLAGWWWCLTGKRIWLWYNHRHGTFLTYLAILLADEVFYTSPQSYAANFKKSQRMPVGIDTDLFQPTPDRRPKNNSLVYVGRLSPVKRLELLIEALIIADQEGTEFTLDLVGEGTDQSYVRELKTQASGLVARNKIRFLGGVSHQQTSQVYTKHRLLVNLTPNGSLDKVIFEAMACGTLVLVVNQALKLDPPFMVTEENPRLLADQIKSILALPEPEAVTQGQRFRQQVIAEHSLSKLVKMLKYKL